MLTSLKDRLLNLRSFFNGTRITIEGSNHRIVRNGASLYRTEIEIRGKNCQLFIGRGARLWDCSLSIVGDGVTVSIGELCALRHVRYVAEDKGSTLQIGAKTTMTRPVIVSQEGRQVVIGTDCMIAQGATIRNSDSHSIFDDKGTRINPAADIIIGNHVWVGIGSYIQKGAVIGDGTIIGAHSMVRGTLPGGCIAVGSPAVPKRTGITWDRKR